MRSVVISQTGSPDVMELVETSRPEPGVGEVLVQVSYSAVNPIDTYIRSGAVALPIELPYTPGCDLSGEVVTVGSGVSRFQEGDRVWGSNQSLFGRKGTLSEFVSVGEEWLYPIPDGVSMEQAAAGALVGITAHLGLFLHADLQPGELVFVNGGTGGVGSAVVQFAKAAGAEVIATCGTAEKLERCRGLGADHVFNYRDANLDDQIRAASVERGGIDIWWETQREPTFDRTIPMMRKRGRIILMAGRAARRNFQSVRST